MKRLLFVFSLFLFVFPIFSQTPAFYGEKEKYILVNGEPYLALLNGKGKILELIRKAPEILKGISNQDKNAIESYYSTRDVPAFKPDRRDAVTMSPQLSLSGEEYMSFGFSEYRARLNKIQIEQLRSLANQFKRGAISHIAVKSIMYESGQDGRELANNRAAACADLLKIFGVSESSLSIDLVQASSSRPEVKILVQ